ncbi:MAG TPA: hypothetical protein VKS60_06690 [Stellaceae bacterium]|nr:hypothetical protein [Stellaceae bacterium]
MSSFDFDVVTDQLPPPRPPRPAASVPPHDSGSIPMLGEPAPLPRRSGADDAATGSP